MCLFQTNRQTDQGVSSVSQESLSYLFFNRHPKKTIELISLTRHSKLFYITQMGPY